MANKHQVLELLAKGLTPQEVARELGCSDAYVRATKQRDTAKGKKRTREYGRAWRARHPTYRREYYQRTGA